MTGPIDEPHSWMQCDRAHYALDFYKNGVNLFFPSLGWLGLHKTVIYEFPFPQMLMTAAYHLFGYDLLWGRATTLLFFMLSAAYLFLIIKYLFDDRLALIGAAVYCILPLSIFYSRAIHIDFFALAFAHMMTYHLMRACNDYASKHFFIGTAAGILGFLIKAPYVFFFILPLSMIAFHQKRVRPVLILAVSFGVATLIFLLWRRHVTHVNSTAPDWFFIPGYTKSINMLPFYLGDIAMRWDGGPWRLILRRLFFEVFAGVGVIFFAGGAILSWIDLRHKRRWQDFFVWAWLIGTIGFLFIFFKASYIHNYYQIPFLSIAAIFIALGIDLPFRRLEKQRGSSALCISLCAFGLLAISSIAYAQRHYFWLDTIRIEAGKIIDRHIPPDVLIIAAANLDGTTGNDPRLLFRAKRNGWSIHKDALNKNVVQKLKDLNAEYLIVLDKATLSVSNLFGYPAVMMPLPSSEYKVYIACLDKLNPIPTKP